MNDNLKINNDFRMLRDIFEYQQKDNEFTITDETYNYLKLYLDLLVDAKYCSCVHVVGQERKFKCLVSEHIIVNDLRKIIFGSMPIMLFSALIKK